MEPEKDKPVTETKEAPPAAATDKDPRGVSWENRAKELERKLQSVEAKMNAAPKPPELPEDKQKRLMEFVEDPDGYMDRHYQQRKFNEELPVAEKWLAQQPHFTTWDDAKALISEHGISFHSPSKAVKTVNELLKARALEREFSEKKRVETVEKSSPEGSVRTAPVNGKPKRHDLIKQLAAAQRKGDSQASYRILNQLEDVRE
jgi:hypothetical protein